MTVAFHLENPELVAHELAQANQRLSREKTVPDSILHLVADLCEQIAETPREQWAGVAANQWIELQQAAMRAQRVVLGEDDEQRQRRDLRLLISELAFRLNRLAEHEVFDDERPIGEIVRWLDAALPVPQSAKAALLGVHERTYQRWVSETEASQPSGDDEVLVRVLARVLNDLRHVMSAKGAVSWLGIPNAGLSGRAPLDVIRDSDPAGIQALFEIVAQARAGSAS